jgi:threonine dehydrogenase-like Zn-dependent dehydrogenase
MRQATNDDGPQCVIDAVGIDARMPHMTWWSRLKHMARVQRYARESHQVFPSARSCPARAWNGGNAPSQVVRWAVDSVAKGGTVSIIGVYPDPMTIFPLGQALAKNITLVGGICNHSAYIPRLLSMVETGELAPETLITQTLPLDAALDGYRHFDQHDAGWIKVVLSLT